MEQTFRKNIGGNNLQFNRLMYPVRYAVKCDEDGSDGMTIEFKKGNDGKWQAIKDGKIPGWVNGHTDEIRSVIEQNENGRH
jgi:hypothetical protein